MNDPSRSLKVLGIEEKEERLYRWLLKHRNASASETAHALTLTPGKAKRLLEALETRGLATHTPERPRRYIPVSPDIALNALVMQRQKDLQGAQILIEELKKEAESEQSDEHEKILEVITSPEAERQVYDQMSRLAQHEILGLVRPPLRSSRLDVSPSEDRAFQIQALRRGVRYRTIADAEFMALPGAAERAREEMESGEDMRVFPELPFKMIISDRKIALVPLSLQQTDGAALLVKSSALLDALCLLFEFIWERSSPISWSRTEGLQKQGANSRLGEQDLDLISLMAAGLNDKTIFMEQGVSRRTHQKHITELMQHLNARTRFQAGWLAALQMSAAGILQEDVPDQKQISQGKN